MRILMIEDDERLSATLERLLAEEGFVPTACRSGEEALAGVDQVDPDIVLTDLGLPGLHGLDVVAALRQRSDVPIVILSGRDGTDDVVAGLEAGADDYVTKPFVARELVARLHAALRRAPAAFDSLDDVQLGRLTLRPRRGDVVLDGRSVALTRTELRLLVVLATSGGGVVSRSELLERVWEYDYSGDPRMVDAHVRRIRLKLEPDPAEPTLLVTVRGQGYRLVV
jgi:DNA-binding response OmpR family regulator